MRRLMILAVLLAAAAAGCRSVDKKDAAGEEPSRWRVPDIFAADKWWTKGELGDVDR
jgi:hypothetical protein